jgi:hypothetical protein
MAQQHVSPHGFVEQRTDINERLSELLQLPVRRRDQENKQAQKQQIQMEALNLNKEQRESPAGHVVLK